jgi:hypothetical protein
MQVSIPDYLAPYILTGTVAAVATLLFGLWRALSRSDWAKSERTRAFWSVSILLAAWFIFALTTSLAGWYRPSSGLPTIQYPILVPILAGVLLFRGWPLLRRMVTIVPNEWLVGLQLYRALGLIFLVLYAAGRLPALFAFPAGIGDVMVGLFAPFVAAAYARSANANTAVQVRRWNWLGIADLVVAVGTGFATSPSPFQLASFDRPNTLIAAFPLALIPVFMVPLSILLHLASLHKVRQLKTTPTLAAVPGMIYPRQ